MKQISERTVELNDAELKAQEEFERFLDNGHGIPMAAKLALNRVPDSITVSFAFGKWLSEDTCYRLGSRAMIRPEWRRAQDNPPIGSGRPFPKGRLR